MTAAAQAETLRKYIEALEIERQILHQQIREQWQPEAREAFTEGLATGHADMLRELKQRDIEIHGYREGIETQLNRNAKLAAQCRSLREWRDGWCLAAVFGWAGVAWRLYLEWFA